MKKQKHRPRKIKVKDKKKHAERKIPSRRSQAHDFAVEVIENIFEADTPPPEDYWEEMRNESVSQRSPLVPLAMALHQFLFLKKPWPFSLKDYESFRQPLTQARLGDSAFKVLALCLMNEKEFLENSCVETLWPVSHNNYPEWMRPYACSEFFNEESDYKIRLAACLLKLTYTDSTHEKTILLDAVTDIVSNIDDLLGIRQNKKLLAIIKSLISAKSFSWVKSCRPLQTLESFYAKNSTLIENEPVLKGFLPFFSALIRRKISSDYDERFVSMFPKISEHILALDLLTILPYEALLPKYSSLGISNEEEMLHWKAVLEGVPKETLSFEERIRLELSKIQLLTVECVSTDPRESLVERKDLFSRFQSFFLLLDKGVEPEHAEKARRLKPLLLSLYTQACFGTHTFRLNLELSLRLFKESPRDFRLLCLSYIGVGLSGSSLGSLSSYIQEPDPAYIHEDEDLWYYAFFVSYERTQNWKYFVQYIFEPLSREQRKYVFRGAYQRLLKKDQNSNLQALKKLCELYRMDKEGLVKDLQTGAAMETDLRLLGLFTFEQFCMPFPSFSQDIFLALEAEMKIIEKSSLFAYERVESLRRSMGLKLSNMKKATLKKQNPKNPFEALRKMLEKEFE
jgi:hypothetical protein